MYEDTTTLKRVAHLLLSAGGASSEASLESMLKKVEDAWKEMEVGTGDEDRLAVVTSKMPKRLKKKRPVRDDAGEEVGWEEYYDYTFPEEEAKAPSLKILEMAHKWKKQKVAE